MVIRIALLSFWLLASVSASAQETPRSTFDEIDSILDEISRITGFKRVRPVSTATISRDGLKTFLEKRIQEVVDPKELRAEEIALKKFGFIPDDFDLKNSTVDLMTEQAAAFYDYREKKLYMLEGGSSEFQRPALIHELAHALADQHFSLQKFVNPGRSDDSVLARMAVVEGQATWLMSEFMARQNGQSLETSPLVVEMMGRAAETVPSQFPVLAKVPLYLRETLLFPYGRGLAFQQAAVVKLKKDGFAEVFRNPPQSTQQVLHPELYFARAKPTSPPLPDFDKPKGFRVLTEGAVGELDHSILIRQYAGSEEAERLAPKLKGAAFRLLEDKEGKRFVLLYTSEWAEPSAAQEYFSVYQRVLKGKWKSMNVAEESSALVIGRGDEGGFQLRVKGARVLSVEGLP